MRASQSSLDSCKPVSLIAYFRAKMWKASGAAAGTPRTAWKKWKGWENWTKRYTDEYRFGQLHIEHVPPLSTEETVIKLKPR